MNGSCVDTFSKEEGGTFLGTFLGRFFWIMPLAFYWYTACRHPGWVDSPMIANHVHYLNTSTWVNSHNLFYLVGKIWSWLVPYGELHYKLVLLCGLFSAVAVHFFFLTGLILTKNRVAALLSALAIMLSHSLWWHSTMLEVYTLNAMLISLLLYLIAKYDLTNNKSYLYGSAFVWGLGCLNHILMGLFVFAYLSLFLFSKKRKNLLNLGTTFFFLFFFIAGFQIYLFLFLKELSTKINAMPEFTYSGFWDVLRDQIDRTTGGHFKKAMFSENIQGQSLLNWRLNYVFLLFLNFPSIFFILGFIGLWSLKRVDGFSSFKIFLLLGLVAQIIWSANYFIWDMYAFGMPVWIMFGLITSLGLSTALNSPKFKKIVVALLPTLIIGPVLYSRVPVLAQEGGTFWARYFEPFDNLKNLWDASEYFGNPNKRLYDRVRKIADEIFEILPPNATLFDDDAKGHYPLALYYQQVLGMRRDVSNVLMFTPEFDDKTAQALAFQAKRLLDGGFPVFFSSLAFPEREVLNHLYGLYSQNHGSDTAAYARGLSVDNLIETFPSFEPRKIKLLGEEKTYIVELARRDGNATKQSGFKLEGEKLVVVEHSIDSHTFAQSLGDSWSGGGHLLSMDNKLGEQVILEFELPRSTKGALYLRFTKSYDFGTVKVSIPSLPGAPVDLDLYAPSPQISEEILMSKGDLPKGNYKIVVTILGANKNAEPRMGFGIDYLAIKPTDN